MDWHLVFEGMTQPYWAGLAAVVVTATAVVCLWLVRMELRLVPQHVAWGLLVLRLGALLLLLFVMMQPVVLSEKDISQQERLVVAVDISGSMRTNDAHATPLELLRWIQALGLLGPDISDDQVQEWANTWATGNEPRRNSDDGLPTNQAGDVRRRHLEQLCTDVGSLQRTQLVGKLLTSAPNNLLRAMEQDFDVDIKVFGSHSRSVPQTQLGELLGSTAGSTTELTDLGGMLSELTGTQDENPLRGVIVLSDGRPTTNVDTVQAGRQLGQAGIPVFTIPVGSEYVPTDIVVHPVDAPGAVFLDDTVRIESKISANGFDGEVLIVRLRRGTELIEERKVVVANGHVSAEFVLPQLPEGNHELTVEADSLPGELSTDNNQHAFSIAVVDNRAVVMLLDQDARWEFRYLDNLLERDGRIELTSILLEQPFLNLLDRTTHQQQLPTAPDLATALSKTDLLIVGDVSPTHLSDSVVAAVVEAVSSEGLTVVVIPGRRNTQELLGRRDIRELLPVAHLKEFVAEDSAPTQRVELQSAFHLVPTAAGATLPMFQLKPGQPDSGSSFERLPGHPWILSGNPRPAASVWATADIAVTNGVRQAPLIMHHYFGSGQVVWMGMDSTWRWRRRAGDTWHHRFWGQMIRWAVRNKSASGNDEVQLTLSSDVISEQQSVDVFVRWKTPPEAAESMSVNIVPAESHADEAGSHQEEPSSLGLNPVPGFPGRFAGQLSALSKGRYTIVLNQEGPAGEVGDRVEAGLTVVERASPELRDVSCDREVLRQVAEASGGQLVEPWQVDQISQLLRQDLDVDLRQQRETALWDQWPVLVGFFLLLMCQWVIRKQSGLP